MKIISAIFFLMIFFSCNKHEKNYAVISHTRLNDNSSIDSIIANTDYSKYDVLLLGGDMANLSSKDDSILNYLDDIFNLSSEKTLWALGNHDYTNVSLLKQYTNKETFYAYEDDEVLFLVLDTQKDTSNIINEQLTFFKSVLDSARAYNHLIILTHQLIWLRDNDKLEYLADSISNGHIGSCNYCIHQNNFYTDLYPQLISIQESGKQVYCIAGDIGFKTKTFEYQTPEGIVFLATGIKGNDYDNYFLKLKLNNNQLSYQFVPLADI